MNQQQDKAAQNVHTLTAAIEGKDAELANAKQSEFALTVRLDNVTATLATTRAELENATTESIRIAPLEATLAKQNERHDSDAKVRR